MMRNLETVDQVITELGGHDAVKELTKRASASAVPTWKWREKFPPNTYAVMKAALNAKGADAPASLWNMAGVA